MEKYNVLLFLIQGIRFIAILLVVIFNYPTTRKFLQELLQEEVDNFHNMHIKNNYNLSMIDTHNINTLPTAMQLINNSPEQYLSIPKEDIFMANMYIKALNNYKSLSKAAIKVILLTSTIELGLLIGTAF